jgi:hypothetical protein
MDDDIEFHIDHPSARDSSCLFIAHLCAAHTASPMPVIRENVISCLHPVDDVRRLEECRLQRNPRQFLGRRPCSNTWVRTASLAAGSTSSAEPSHGTFHHGKPPGCRVVNRDGRTRHGDLFCPVFGKTGAREHLRGQANGYERRGTAHCRRR